MKARVWALWVVLGLVVVPAWHALAQAPPASPAVATVADRRIGRDEFERRVAAYQQQMAARGEERPAEFKDLLRRQMLETLIRMNLLTLEAKRLGLTATGAEAESVLKRDPFFSPDGRFDTQRWNMTRMSQPARMQAALLTAGEQLVSRRLDERMKARYRPDEGILRQRALRLLRHAITEDLSLRASDFNGNYPEPRESGVLAYYRDHLQEWRRPERATLSVVFVNDPPMTAVERSDAAAGAAWTQRMRLAADSVLAAAAGGSRLEQASAAYGGPRADVSVLPDNFPGYWQGDEAAKAAVFKTAVGRTLPHPVRGTEGWLVVRVDKSEPAHTAPLAAVSKDIRGRLREDSRLHHEERERRLLFETLRDSLSGPAWTFRYAVVDTGALRIAEPTEAELDRWYRGHLADFSSFDPKSGSIVAKPLAQVRDEAKSRWKRERRLEMARVQADDLYQAWSSGRRAAALEGSLRVRDTKPAPRGADIDTGFAAAALSDTVWRRGEPRGAGIAPFARGFLVWQVTGRIASHTPVFEQVEPALAVALDARRRAIDEASARKLFAADPKRFGGGRTYVFTRMVVRQPPLDRVKLTRAQVENWHRRNIGRYSADELVRAKHVLISPISDSPAADRAARARADSLLARIRAGERIEDIAARFSDDPATRDKGGDLGVFARGAMLEPFERAAFAMQEGELRGPIKTEVGYHIILCTEHVASYVQPLKLVYSIVASDLARTEADTIAMLQADSLVRVIRTAAQGRAVAAKLGLDTPTFTADADTPNRNPALAPYFEKLYALKAGEVMPIKWQAKGEGYWITWVDSIISGAVPNWESARVKALAAYREGAGERALMLKVAELDSLSHAGWSFDSLGALWGGLNRSRELSAGATGERGALPAALDSLVFGDDLHPAALEVGQTSQWVRWPGGIARVRLMERREPSPDRVKARVDELGKAAIERKLTVWFDELKRRYPVRILDRSLAAIPLPEPPPEE